MTFESTASPRPQAGVLFRRLGHLFGELSPGCRPRILARMDDPSPAPDAELDAGAAVSPAVRAPLPTGMSHGAALFALRAVTNVILSVAVPDERGAPDPTLFVAGLVDAGLAVALVVGWERAIALGLARAVIAGVVETFACVAMGLHGLAVMMLVGALALAIVLSGVPSTLRARAGVALGAAHAIVLVVAVTTGTGVGAFSLGPITEIRGQNLPYHITLPPTGWEIRDDETVAYEGPDADVWAIRSDVLAHLVVVPELGVDPAATSLDDRERALVAGLEEHAQVAVLDREDIARGRVVHLVVREPGHADVEIVAGVFLVPGVAYLVQTAIESARFEEHESELRGMVRSFDPGP